jgi:AraC-like DNA-binding protein
MTDAGPSAVGGENPGNLAFSAWVREQIRALMPEGRTNIDAVATHTGFRRRSLQRYLADNGLSFSELLQEARIGMAVELLANRRTSLTQIALELGYSESASFTRAFRRWTGSTPSAYRQRLLAEQPLVA